MRSLLRACLTIGGCLAMPSCWTAAEEPSREAAEPDVLMIARPADAGPSPQCVAISTDGKLVAAGFGGGTNGRFPLEPRGGGVAIYDREAGKRLHFAPEYGDVIQLQFSGDGHSLIYTRLYTPGDSIDDNRVVVIDVATGKERQHWEVDQVAASVAGNLLAMRRARGIEVYDIENLTRRHELDVRSARVIALSPDARLLATIVATRSDPELQLIELSSGTVLHSASKPELRMVLALVWSRDGTLLATGHAGGGATLWSASDLTARHTFAVETAAHVRPVFAPGGDALWLFSQPVQGMRWTYDQGAASGFKFENARTETDCDAWSFGVTDFEPRAHWRFVDASFRTWYARFGRSNGWPEYNPTRFAMSVDGRYVVAGCHGAALYDLASGKLVQQFSPPEQPPAAEQK
ncbi:MAG: WD40 repeat domain-containing protein [Pirellulales bacterium]|nr:WD40 repeat domain-containing protein [Pirellulales bacterium]